MFGVVARTLLVLTSQELESTNPDTGFFWSVWKSMAMKPRQPSPWRQSGSVFRLEYRDL
jgi:hypothetical protein